jgi:hypothetical protein
MLNLKQLNFDERNVFCLFYRGNNGKSWPFCHHSHHPDPSPFALLSLSLPWAVYNHQVSMMRPRPISGHPFQIEGRTD